MLILMPCFFSQPVKLAGELHPTTKTGRLGPGRLALTAVNISGFSFLERAPQSLVQK